MLDEALKGLGSLKRVDQQELRAFKNPPSLVNVTIEAVCIMMKVKPKMVPNGRSMISDYWGPARNTLLGSRDFSRNSKIMIRII